MNKIKNFFRKFSVVPLAGWLIGSFVAVLMEYYLGDLISYYLYLPKIPVLFGALMMLKEPLLIPSVLAYDLIIYALPILLLGKLLAPFANGLASMLERTPLWVATLIHLVAIYGMPSTNLIKGCALFMVFFISGRALTITECWW